MIDEIRTLARKFARTEIAPIIEEDDAAHRFRPELIEKLGAVGLAGIPVPEELGGAGLGYQEYIAAIEEIASVSAAYAISVAVSGLPQLVLLKYGTPELQKKYIPKLAAGKAIGAFALSEISSGSDAGSLRTVATLQKDHYLIKGTKFWISQADSAEIIIVMARTGGPGPKGISAFIVEKNWKGVKFGKCEQKMAMNTSHTMEVIFDSVKVPLENRVGKEGEGFKIAMTALDSGRITIGATSVGIAQEALHISAKYSQERHQFGHSISEFQGVLFMLADMETRTQASRLLVQQAAQIKDAGKTFVKEAAMAKLFASDTAMAVTTDAVQILGGAGYTKEFPLERLMREAKAMQIVEGTNQIQRIVVGRHLLRGLTS